MQRHEADREQKRQNQGATCGAYRVADQQRMAARRALEWIGASEAWLVFRYHRVGRLYMLIPTNSKSLEQLTYKPL